ncbi:MAG: hypothetical protein CM15mP12_1530 [Gammaproteobacteria bacterium]|nr:MAG: hypothetical protein CM15mP12_1530 [Gammaproteobacteria bacterium]
MKYFSPLYLFDFGIYFFYCLFLAKRFINFYGSPGFFFTDIISRQTMTPDAVPTYFSLDLYFFYKGKKLYISFFFGPGFDL